MRFKAVVVYIFIYLLWIYVGMRGTQPPVKQTQTTADNPPPPPPPPVVVVTPTPTPLSGVDNVSQPTVDVITPPWSSFDTVWGYQEAMKSDRCTSLETILAQQEHLPYYQMLCPLSHGFGLTNIMMVYTYCILMAHRFAQPGLRVVYLPLPLQLGTVHDLFDVDAFAKRVTGWLNGTVSVRVMCPASQSAMRLLPNVRWETFGTAEQRRAVWLHHVKVESPRPSLLRFDNAFFAGVHTFSDAAVVPFTIELMTGGGRGDGRRVESIVSELRNALKTSISLSSWVAVHARLESGDSELLLGKRFAQRFDNFAALLRDIDRNHSAASGGALGLYLTVGDYDGREKTVLGGTTTTRIVSKRRLLSPSSLQSLTAETHFSPTMPFFKHRKGYVTLTNASGAYVDFKMLLEAPVAVTASYSSFGYWIYLLRCGLRRRTLLYDATFRVMAESFSCPNNNTKSNALFFDDDLLLGWSFLVRKDTLPRLKRKSKNKKKK
eukprot:PhM_4_TR14099/c0_g1_i5/m.49774